MGAISSPGLVGVLGALDDVSFARAKRVEAVVAVHDHVGRGGERLVRIAVLLHLGPAAQRQVARLVVVLDGFRPADGDFFLLARLGRGALLHDGYMTLRHGVVDAAATVRAWCVGISGIGLDGRRGRRRGRRGRSGGRAPLGDRPLGEVHRQLVAGQVEARIVHAHVTVEDGDAVLGSKGRSLVGEDFRVVRRRRRIGRDTGVRLLTPGG